MSKNEDTIEMIIFAKLYSHSAPTVKESIFLGTVQLKSLDSCLIPITSSSNTNSAKKLVDNFSSQTSDIIDSIAATKAEVDTGRKKSQWTSGVLVRTEKREC